MADGSPDMPDPPDPPDSAPDAPSPAAPPSLPPRRRWRLRRAPAVVESGAHLTPDDQRTIAEGRRLGQRLSPRRRPTRAVPEVGRSTAAPPDPTHPLPPDELRVMTLNLAHGRSTGFHQALLRRRTIRDNLRAIAEMLRRERPQLVAMQEADKPCLWSGGFDHVAYVADAAGLGFHVHGRHVTAPRLAYGTAIASRLPLSHPLSVAFAPSPPTFTKGFVVSTVRPPQRPDLEIDVVSVHLDFARAAVRRRQVETLIETLRPRDRLRVVLGDFNTTWDAAEGSIRRLADGLGLVAHAPDEPMVTFPFHGTRLDWILASAPLEFRAHRVLPDRLSDHLAVLARLALPR